MASDEEFVAGTSETASPSVKQVNGKYATPANIITAITGLASETYVNQQIAQSNPIGTIITWSTPTAPAGYLICDGSAISRTTYAALFAVIGTIYGEGDGNTTFNLPNFIDRFLRCSTNVGEYIAQGLPEITGAFNFPTGWSGSTAASGAFTYNSLGVAGNFAGGGAQGVTAQFTFSAKRSNPIYGASTVVMPSAATVAACIKY